MMTHTPTPWRVEADMRSERAGDGYTEYCAGYNIYAENGTEVVGVEGIIDADDTNAAFIVKACNSYDNLVEAVKALIEDAGWEDMTMDELEYERDQGNQMVLSTISAKKLLESLNAASE